MSSQLAKPLTRAELVLYNACGLFGVEPERVKAGTRNKRCVAARIVFCGVMRESLPFSYPDLGEALQASHTTALRSDHCWRGMDDSQAIVGAITKGAARAYVMRASGI